MPTIRVSRTHIRLPGYIRGQTGVVDIIQPAHVLPDTNAHFLGENPQHVYTVRFDSRELVGADAERFALTVDMYESYLETTARPPPPAARTNLLPWPCAPRHWSSCSPSGA
ncbi:SH3-like domain-containing protein [Streptomyces sp. NPDC001796]|uniref:SH3-like domain-containing protein n=1 Tax=Streptomyces sp. NPDC001796 TaxID=3364609 RepID=UPI0036B0D2EA